MSVQEEGSSIIMQLTVHTLKRDAKDLSSLFFYLQKESLALREKNKKGVTVIPNYWDHPKGLGVQDADDWTNGHNLGEVLLAERECVLVAKNEEEKLVAYAVLSSPILDMAAAAVEKQEERKLVVLRLFEVLRDFRGLGYGSAFLETMVDMAQRSGFEYLGLEAQTFMGSKGLPSSMFWMDGDFFAERKRFFVNRHGFKDLYVEEEALYFAKPLSSFSSLMYASSRASSVSSVSAVSAVERSPSASVSAVERSPSPSVLNSPSYTAGSSSPRSTADSPTPSPPSSPSPSPMYTAESPLPSPMHTAESPLPSPMYTAESPRYTAAVSPVSAQSPDYRPTSPSYVPVSPSYSPTSPSFFTATAVGSPSPTAVGLQGQQGYSPTSPTAVNSPWQGYSPTSPDIAELLHAYRHRRRAEVPTTSSSSPQPNAVGSPGQGYSSTPQPNAVGSPGLSYSPTSPQPSAVVPAAAAAAATSSLAKKKAAGGGTKKKKGLSLLRRAQRFGRRLNVFLLAGRGGMMKRKKIF